MDDYQEAHRRVVTRRGDSALNMNMGNPNARDIYRDFKRDVIREYDGIAGQREVRNARRRSR